MVELELGLAEGEGLEADLARDEQICAVLILEVLLLAAQEVGAVVAADLLRSEVVLGELVGVEQAQEIEEA